MIDKAIKQRELLKSYKNKVLESNNLANNNVKLDQIILDNWKILTKIKSILKPFYKVAKQLKKNLVKGLNRKL